MKLVGMTNKEEKNKLVGAPLKMTGKRCFRTI